MNNYYTSERNIQIVIAILKANGIRKVIASPGATDVSLNASMQHDPWFEMYSEVDERGAAYMACGMAAESGEPVVITCTGATSSRNYMPGLTEAYYRKLPVLAITCCRSNANVGHYVDQVTDRSNPPHDTVNISVYCQSVRTSDDEWDVMVKANKAILGLRQNGGGPCHINLETTYQSDYTVKEIPFVRIIKRYTTKDKLPDIPNGRIGIFVGAHEKWSNELTEVVDKFCQIYNAVVFCDHTSNYKGKYRVLFPLLYDQLDSDKGLTSIDLLIHIGYVSNCICKGKYIWRVNEDGEIRDTFRKMVNVFQMSEYDFFNSYINVKQIRGNTLLDEYKKKYEDYLNLLPELPFSNMWVAKKLASKLPDHSVIHFGIRNSLRSWNYFEIPQSVLGYSNTGGFGIDGGLSSLIGASFCNPQKLYFGVFGDLLFFYNMNSIGNRDIKSNVRILLINNGLGQEFKNFGCSGYTLGDEANKFISAEGHFAKKSQSLVKMYAESLGFEYLTASCKNDFENEYRRFINPDKTDKPMLFEVFTDTKEETEAFRLIITLSTVSKLKHNVTDLVNAPELASIKSTVKRILKK